MGGIQVEDVHGDWRREETRGGDVRFSTGRYRGGTREVQGRYRGGTGEIQGRYRETCAESDVHSRRGRKASHSTKKREGRWESTEEHRAVWQKETQRLGVEASLAV